MEQATRLGVAYETWSVIASEHGAQVGRVWFIGANPWLRYDTPVDAIREGRFAEVAAAARAISFIHGSKESLRAGWLRAIPSVGC